MGKLCALAPTEIEGVVTAQQPAWYSRRVEERPWLTTTKLLAPGTQRHSHIADVFPEAFVQRFVRVDTASQRPVWLPPEVRTDLGNRHLPHRHAEHSNPKTDIRENEQAPTHRKERKSTCICRSEAGMEVRPYSVQRPSNPPRCSPPFTAENTGAACIPDKGGLKKVLGCNFRRFSACFSGTNSWS